MKKLKIAQIAGIAMIGIGIGIGYQPEGSFTVAALGLLLYVGAALTAWVKRDK